MDTNRWQRIKALFQEAVKRAPHERPAFLDEVCGDDTDLRKKVEALLASHDDSGDFLEVMARAKGEGAVENVEELVGERIGQYRVERVISVGGMGTVYEAQQEHPHRVVAIKIMREGLTSHSALRRFEYESEILARLKHPGIAQVIESGTHGGENEGGAAGAKGTPYFVMEYIEGALPVTGYAREKEISTRERLGLFLQVLDAVQHGHQKGVIHRDLKPSNILVDARGQVKIIDFGVARATDADRTLTTVQTDVRKLIGTVQYMSPEQFKADPRDVDVRSDVYALGVVLYQLLCEELPYDVRRTAIFEAARVVRETEPKRPSTTKRALRGDLETIVLKTLEKERERRYQSVAEFSEDLRRYLRGDVILARPAGPATRFWKRVKRNPVVSAALAVAVAACISFAGYVLLWSLPRIRAERDEAELQRQAAVAAGAEAEQERNKAVEALEEAGRQREAALDARAEAEQQREAALDARAEAEQEAALSKAVSAFLEEMLSSPRPFKDGSEVKVVDVLDDAARRIETAFEEQPEIEASLRNTLGLTYFTLSRDKEAEEQLRAALKITEIVRGREHPFAARIMSNLARALKNQGRLEEAESLLREATDIQKRVLGEEDPRRLFNLTLLAWVLTDRGGYGEAETLLRATIKAQEHILGEEDMDTLKSKNFLAELLIEKTAYSEAEELLRDVIETFREGQNEDDPGLLTAMNALGMALNNLAKYDEAESIHRKVYDIRRPTLGEDHQETLNSLNNLGVVLQNRQKYSEAETIFRDLLGFYREKYEKDHPMILGCLQNLSTVLGRQNKLEEAKEILLELVAQRRKALGPGHRNTLASMNNLALVYYNEGAHVEAERLHREVWEGRIRIYGEMSPLTLSSLDSMGDAVAKQGRLSEAEGIYRKVLKGRRKVLRENHPSTLYTLRELGSVLLRQGKYEEAESLYRKLLETRRRILPKNHPDTALTLFDLSLVFMKQGRWSDAEASSREALSMARKALPGEHYLQAHYSMNYGECLFRLGRCEEAEPLLLDAYELYQEPGTRELLKNLNILELLVEFYESLGKPEEAAKYRDR